MYDKIRNAKRSSLLFEFKFKKLNSPHKANKSESNNYLSGWNHVGEIVKSFLIVLSVFFIFNTVKGFYYIKNNREVLG